MLNVLLVGVSLIAGMATATAQEQTKKTPEQRAEMHTTRMTKALELTEEQRSKVAELNLGVAMKNEAVRNSTTMTKEQKQEAVQGNHEGRKAQLKMILSEEQYKKFEEHDAQIQVKKAAKKEAVKKKKAQKEQTTSPEVIEEL